MLDDTELRRGVGDLLRPEQRIGRRHNRHHCEAHPDPARGQCRGDHPIGCVGTDEGQRYGSGQHDANPEDGEDAAADLVGKLTGDRHG